MCFTDPKDAEKPEDDARDKPDKEPANPEVADEVTVRAEVHKADEEDYPLDEGAAGGADEEEDEDEEEEEEDEDEEDPEWDVIQEQVEAGKIKIKVQAGNHNKRVMQPQSKPYQAGRNFKPIFVVDFTRD